MTICPKIKRHFYTTFGDLTQTSLDFAESDSFSVTFRALGNEFFASKCTISFSALADDATFWRV